jgi:acyl-CoA oxidase
VFSHLTGIRQTTLLLASIAHYCFLGWQTGKLDFMPTLGIGQPALDLATAFPQATPASIFPPSVSDYYQLDDLLSSEDVALRKRVRDVMETHIAPVMAKYWEKAEFPFEVVPKLASLMVAGGTIKGYGCPGLSVLGSALTMSEVARVDASCSTFLLVHSSLCMTTIGMYVSSWCLSFFEPSVHLFKSELCDLY